MIPFLFFLAMGLVIPQARGQYQTQSLDISTTQHDGFLTPAGILIDSSLIHILDPNMDIRAYLVFTDIIINNWEILNNATLRIRSASDLPFDADSSVTIQGLNEYKLQHVNWFIPGYLFSAPVTSAYVNVNTSSFSGGGWLEIDVTNIVNELIRHPFWDGDGPSGVLSGDDIGFIFLGAQDEIRYFYDYKGNPDYSADLIINWGESPQPPSAQAPPVFQNQTWEYVNTSDIPGETNRTGDVPVIDIFKVTDFGDVEFQFMGVDSGGDLWYHNNSRGLGNEIEIPGTVYRYESGAIDPIISLDPWTFMIADNGSTEIYWSDDEFLTWSTSSLSAQFPVLNPFGGNYGSLALDPDGETIHVVWSSVTPWENAVYNVLYTNFTLDQATGDLVWATDYVNITNIGATQFHPVIYCQNNGTLHIAWHGHQGTAQDQIWYMRRQANGTWMAQVRVTEGDALDSMRPDVVANEDTGVALVVWAYDQVGLQDLYWDVVYPNNTDDVDRLWDNNGVAPSMVNDRANNVAQVVFQDDAGPSIKFMTKAIDNATAWGAQSAVSPNGEQHYYPDIGLESVNRTIVVIWRNTWNTWTAYNTWQIGDAPVIAKLRVSTDPILGVYIEDEIALEILNQTYWVAWGNGTLIGGPFDTLEEAEDFIEIFLGPHPLDPNPSTQGYPESGPFTRFRMRAYVFMMGFFCVFGPIWFFAWKRPSAYYLMVGALIIITGLGLMMSVTTI